MLRLSALRRNGRGIMGIARIGDAAQSGRIANGDAPGYGTLRVDARWNGDAGHDESER